MKIKFDYSEDESYRTLFGNNFKINFNSRSNINKEVFNILNEEIVALKNDKMVFNVSYDEKEVYPLEIINKFIKDKTIIDVEINIYSDFNKVIIKYEYSIFFTDVCLPELDYRKTDELRVDVKYKKIFK